MAALAIHPANDLHVTAPAIAVLRDGASILIRPAAPTDGARLQRMFYRLSPTTIYRWSFAPALSHERWTQTIANIATIDYQNQYVMVASYAGEIIGIARYDRNPASQEAEYGIVIEDAWQARGLGRLLASHLILEANRHDITAFSAIILGENRPALRLVSSLFDKPAIHWRQGECQITASLESFKPPISYINPKQPQL
ncbi:MAG TPA: GNAT family N-acetyltransferase [Ktedonobacterales bacterium]|nr:GNAT family N-acetyltransferase [Ktedonobacterales bacterium]